MTPVPFPAMHIPDGFLNIPVSLVGWMLSILLIGLALRQTRTDLGERQTPLMGILAAFVFAAQMINFPVVGGTSGHLIGGTLVAILLGPWAAVLVMTCVVAVQALIFQDGGLVVLGFNIFNMAVISAFVGYAAYKGVMRILRDTPNSQLIGAGVGAWLGLIAGAAACALQLAASGTSPLGVVLPAMLIVHAVIGIGEALITVGALAFIRQTRPDLIGASTPTAQGSTWVAVGLLIALAITFASPLASPDPDGLERVAEDHDFLEAAQAAPYEIIPDYQVPFIQDANLSTIAAGIIGVLIVAGIGYAIARMTQRKITDQA